MATGQVNDRQTAHGDSACAVNMHAFVIGAAMDRDITHRREQVRCHRPPVQPINAVNAAHTNIL